MANGTKVGTAYVEITGDNSRLKRTLRETERVGKRAGSVIEKEFDQVDRSMSRATVAAQGLHSGLAQMALLVGTGLSFGYLIDRVSEFSSVMAEVKVLTKATEIQFQQLEAQAKLLGASTRFAATEAGEAQSFLARAGFNVNEILKATPGVLNLAAAGSLELADAADISSNVLQGFRLDVEEMARVIDVMAYTANNSNTTVQQLGQAMSFAAPIAAELGISIEETAAAIGVLGDNGIQGTRAGTSLNGVIASLAAPSKRSQKRLAELGLTLEDIDVKANGLTDVFQKFKDAGIETGQIFRIFGREAGPGFAAMTANMEILNDKIAKTQTEAKGAAAQVASGKSDSLAGSMKEAGSAAEALALAIGALGVEAAMIAGLDALAKVLRNIANALTAVSEAIGVTDIDRITSAFELVRSEVETLDETLMNIEGFDALRMSIEDSIEPLTLAEQKYKDLAAAMKESGVAARQAAIDQIRVAQITNQQLLSDIEAEITDRQSALDGRAGKRLGNRGRIQSELDEALKTRENIVRELERLEKRFDLVFNQSRPEDFVPTVEDNGSPKRPKSSVDAPTRSLIDQKELVRLLADLELARAEKDEERVIALEKQLETIRRIGQYTKAGIADAEATARADVEALFAARALTAEREEQAELQEKAEKAARRLADHLYRKFENGIFTNDDGSGGGAGYGETEAFTRESFEQNIRDGLQAAVASGDWGAAMQEVIYRSASDALVDAVNVMADELLTALGPLLGDLFGNAAGGLFGESGAFGGVGNAFAGFFAKGGTVRGNQWAIVGEEGPEIFVPGTTGTVIPNGAAMQMSSKDMGAGQINIGGPQIVIQGDASETTVRLIDQRLREYRAALPSLIDNRVIEGQSRGRF